MEKNINMDSHKLIYHPRRIAEWMKGKTIYPLEIEISPSGACNHRCVFCAVDYVGYQAAFLEKDNLLKNMKQMQKKGVKSVICSGEGEPLLNKDMPEIAVQMKNYGIDVAMSSNGALLTKEVSSECLHAFTWIRFSISSLEENSYQNIQRGRQDDLERVKSNLYEAVKIKKDKKLTTTLGAQCLLLPQNQKYVTDMAKQLREIGVDYFTIKPYSKHLHSENCFKVNYEEMLDLEEELKEYETEKFQIYFRANAMKKIHKEKRYHQCLGLPFMTHIDARGNVWPCVAHIGVEEFCYGNIYKNTFEEIWEGTRKQEILHKFELMDTNHFCREACRLDEINNYLSELKNPGEHVNFI